MGGERSADQFGTAAEQPAAARKRDEARTTPERSDTGNTLEPAEARNTPESAEANRNRQPAGATTTPEQSIRATAEPGGGRNAIGSSQPSRPRPGGGPRGGPNITRLDPDELVELLRSRLAEHQARTADPTGLRCAAVLVPLLFRDGQSYLLFTQRSEGLRTHKGQISFPGGSLDRCDADLAAAALRETHEEVGIPPEQVRLLGRLDDHATNTTGFVITPFVGVVPAGAAHLASNLEVARIVEVPLAALLDPATLQPDHRTRHGQYVWRDTVIWGATARILTSFLGILASPSSS